MINNAYYTFFEEGFIEGFKQSYLISYFYTNRRLSNLEFTFPKLTESDYYYIAAVLNESIEDVKRHYPNGNRLLLSVVRDYEIGIIYEDMIEWDENKLKEKARIAYLEKHS